MSEPASPAPESLWQAFKTAPSQADALIFAIVSFIGANIAKSALGRLVRAVGWPLAWILEAISPAMPMHIGGNTRLSSVPSGFYRGLFNYVFPIAIFLCFAMNGVLTFFAGTLWGSGESNLSYSVDFYSHLLYLIVVPAYVSAALSLIATFAIAWPNLRYYYRPAPNTRKQRTLHAARLAACVIVTTAFSAAAIINYHIDLADSRTVNISYWFFSQEEAGGRILNAAGIYYFPMNAVLLFISAGAFLCFLAVSIELFRFGSNIASSSFAVPDAELTAQGVITIKQRESQLRNCLYESSLCYVWAKVLVLAYAINIWIWQISPGGRVSNVQWAIFALVGIGVFFLIVPHLYLASKWYALKRYYVQRVSVPPTDMTIGDDLEYDTLTFPMIEKIVVLLDVGFVAFLGIVLGYQFGISGIADFFLNIQKSVWPK